MLFTTFFYANLPYVLFPVFWKPSYDWSPGQDKGGVAITTLQLMLMQNDNDEIYLCPAWPRKWDVKFKLHGPKRTTIIGELKGGELNYSVYPKERASAIHSLFGKNE